MKETCDIFKKSVQKMTADLKRFRNFSVPSLRNYYRPTCCTKNIAMPRRKTYNYLLLLFIVFSGLAGTPTDDILSKKERKFAREYMKNTRMSLQEAVKGLSEEQLNYRISASQWSIKECVSQIAVSEKYLWELLEKNMKQLATHEKKKHLKFTDEEIIRFIENRNNNIKIFNSAESLTTYYMSVDDALGDFRATRAAHIKYIKATSEELRNHFVHMPFGVLDCYQLSLMISALTNRYTQELLQIQSHANFPR